jgi:very-short-patch-repair endonuclease
MQDSLDVRKPFTRKAWVRQGLDPGLLRRCEFQQVIRSVWIHQDGVDEDSRIRAALILHPEDAVASHFSAAKLLDLPVPEHLFEHVTVFRPEDRRWRVEVKPHVTTRPRGIWIVRGIRCTDPITTFVQLAGCLPLVDLVVLGDAIVKRYKVPPARLLRACRETADYYAGAALRAARFVRRGVDSPMETRLRMLLVLAGLPEPVVDVREMNEDGTWRRRYDLCYPEFKVVVEYDGRQHAEDIAQWHVDLERREELDRDDFRIVVVTAKGIFLEPDRTIERVRCTLIAQGCTADLTVDERWKEHFRY